MWDIMAERHAKYGFLFSPASARPPIGTSAVKRVMTLAGCSVPNLTNLCRVHSVNLRTRPSLALSACPPPPHQKKTLVPPWHFFFRGVPLEGEGGTKKFA